MCLLLDLRVGVNCWFIDAPVGEGVDLTRQDPWYFKIWEVCVVVWKRRINICWHMVHPERRTLEYLQNLPAQVAFVGSDAGALKKLRYE